SSRPPAPVMAMADALFMHLTSVTANQYWYGVLLVLKAVSIRFRLVFPFGPAAPTSRIGGADSGSGFAVGVVFAVPPAVGALTISIRLAEELTKIASPP